MEDLVLMVILFYSCVYTLSVRTHSCRTLSELVKSKWGFSKVGLLGRKLPLVLLMLRSSCVETKTGNFVLERKVWKINSKSELFTSRRGEEMIIAPKAVFNIYFICGYMVIVISIYLKNNCNLWKTL